jgi:transposase
MSTSILYHAFGLKGIHYESSHFSGDCIYINARMTDQFVRCPECRNRRASFKGQKRRLLRMSPIGRKRCFLDLLLHRLKCLRCGHLWWPTLPFMDGKHRYVSSFALTALDLLKFGTIRSVAEYLAVSWDLVKEIHKERLSLLYRSVPLHKVKYLGIDEFSLRKGHDYMTIFVDIENGRILHAVEGRSKEKIQPFIDKLSKKAKKLTAIAMDMSGSYYSAVRGWLPHVDIVFDRYHISALMNQAIDEIRRGQQRELDELGQKSLKGNRFLLLRNYHSLDPDRKARLDALLKANHPLFIAHSMKEQLRLFWDNEEFDRAKTFLDVWIKDAMQSGISPLGRVAKTLAGYKTGLLNYFKYSITSAVVEGTNNKIKTLKRQAYGFRDMVYFKLRLYHLHTQRYSLAG